MSDKKPKTDPLVKSMREVYRQSTRAQWDKLLADESRWKRKLTIAQNKLGEVRVEMNVFTSQCVAAIDGHPEPEAKAEATAAEVKPQ